MNKGYFGIGIYMPKTSENIGTLWRSAANMGASFLFTIGTRCMWDQASDTVKAYNEMPFYVYPDWESFTITQPNGCRLIGIEQTATSSNILEYEHPEKACYILGSEDNGLHQKILPYCTGGIIHIPTPRCLNVAVAGSIVMYDRMTKLK